MLFSMKRTEIESATSKQFVQSVEYVFTGGIFEDLSNLYQEKEQFSQKVKKTVKLIQEGSLPAKYIPAPKLERSPNAEKKDDSYYYFEPIQRHPSQSPDTKPHQE